MSNFYDDFKEDIKNYNQTDWKALLRKDLAGDHLVELKPHLDIIKTFFDLCITNQVSLSFKQQSKLKELLIEFEEKKRTIMNHNIIYTNRDIVDSVIQFKDYVIDSLSSICQFLFVKENIEKMSKDDKYNKKFSSISEELKKTQNQVANLTLSKVASSYGDIFKKQANSNKTLSKKFGVLFYTASLLSCVVVYCFFQFDDTVQSSYAFELIIKSNLINKVFVFSIMLLIISSLRREYLALRHQFTLNTHRQNGIESHKAILDSVKETQDKKDIEISNAILLELTKAIFDPQETGFVKAQSSSYGNKIIEISKSALTNTKK